MVKLEFTHSVYQFCSLYILYKEQSQRGNIFHLCRNVAGIWQGKYHLHNTNWRIHYKSACIYDQDTRAFLSCHVLANLLVSGFYRFLGVTHKRTRHVYTFLNMFCLSGSIFYLVNYVRVCINTPSMNMVIYLYLSIPRTFKS